MWQPIETAPNGGEEILVSGFKYDEKSEGRWVCIAQFGRGEWWGTDGETLHSPTHWMPLPEPPTE